MLILCGKSASGKDTVQKELVNKGMNVVVSYTTRPPRPHEIDGVAYHFVTKEDFLKKESQGFFAETTSYNVASGETWYYGSALEDLTDDKVIILNPEGLRETKKVKSLNPVVFYLTADEKTIWNRLKQRGDDLAEARRRLNADYVDFADIINEANFSIKTDSGFSPIEIANIIYYLYNTTIDINKRKEKE